MEAIERKAIELILDWILAMFLSLRLRLLADGVKPQLAMTAKVRDTFQVPLLVAFFVVDASLVKASVVSTAWQLISKTASISNTPIIFKVCLKILVL